MRLNVQQLTLAFSMLIIFYDSVEIINYD